MSQLVQRIVEAATEKIKQLESELLDLCEAHLGPSLRALEEFTGIKMELRLVPVEKSESLTTTSTKAMLPKKSRRSKKRQQKQTHGGYTEICKKLPAILKKVGARKKKFTTIDVKAVLKSEGVDCDPAWVSLALSKGLSGVTQIGKTVNEATGRQVNLFQLNGRPVEIAARN